MAHFVPSPAYHLNEVHQTANISSSRPSRKRRTPSRFDSMEGASNDGGSSKRRKVGESSRPNSSSFTPESDAISCGDLVGSSKVTTDPASISNLNLVHYGSNSVADASTINTLDASSRAHSKRRLPESSRAPIPPVSEEPPSKRHKGNHSTSANSSSTDPNRIPATNGTALQELNGIKSSATTEPGQIIGHVPAAASAKSDKHKTMVDNELDSVATTTVSNEPQGLTKKANGRAIAKPKSKRVRFLDAVAESVSGSTNLAESTNPQAVAGSSSVRSVPNAQYRLPRCFFPRTPKKRKHHKDAYAELNHLLPPARKMRKGGRLSPPYDTMAVEHIARLRKAWTWSYLSRDPGAARITATIEAFDEELKTALKKLSRANTSRRNLGSYLREMALIAAKLAKWMKKIQILGDEKNLLKHLRSWCEVAEIDREMIQGWVDSFGTWRD